MPFFSKLFFQANFSKKLWKTLEKIGKIGKTFSNFGAYIRRNTFARLRYIRRCPSFIFTRAFADLTTVPAIMMTSLKKTSGPVCRPDRLLGLSVTAQRRPRAACAGGCKHNAARRMLSARRGESIADNAHSVEDHQSSAPEFK